ncbi:glycosyltransferase involved in cell wall biosynthesis [Paenibacillus polymyxa]|uniref:glycosyltransferase n=1 Tax=Paenibacillus polymyxa TaxID=1406 RepID=UPI00278FD9BC|nr:glycosyltransferase [Paenibacillus polymyxa]MDQ0048935.1 glycosyltransferase involved in cell wall biosynthesis [Paenibacillus polymyxa]
MNKTISLCMIVKDEEQVLGRCLESAKDIVHEIIILDTGSTDNTIEIARKYTDNVYFYKWTNDFAAARNESLKHATSDFVLILDADEFLEEGCDLQQDVLSNCDYYLCHIKNQISYERSFTFNAVRLFKNHISLKYENRLHEHINVMNGTIQYKMGQAKMLINHVGYTDQRMIEKDKHNRNLPLMQLEVAENPSAYNLFNMGKTYFAIQEYGKAIEYFRKAYPLSKDRIFLPELLTKLAYALAEMKRLEDALSVLTDGVMMFPKETEMIYILGMIYQKAEYYRDAEACFRKCIELGDQGSLITEGSGGYMSHMRLSELYEETGQLEDSYREVSSVLSLKKNFAPALQRYLNLTLKLNMSSEDIQNGIQQHYALKSVDDLQQLLDIMYGVRNPLLEYYLTTYNITVQPNVLATSKIYGKKYREASRLWNEIEDKENENGQDLLLLSFVLGDTSNLMCIQSLLNLSNKEKLTLERMITGHNGKYSLTPALEDLLLEICRHMIILQEFEQFQELVGKLIEAKSEIQPKVSRVLSNYGFDELAIDLLIETFKKQSNNVYAIRLLGDLCLRNNYFEDTQLFYAKLLTLNSQYSSYERSLNYFEKINDLAGMAALEKEIAQRFPYTNVFH